MPKTLKTRGTSHLLAEPIWPHTGILSLSLDALLNIFAFLVNAPLDQTSDIMPFPFIVARVCRQWNEIAYNNSCLWTNICLSPKSAFDVEQFLKRSKESLITLSIIFPDKTPSSKLIQKLKQLLPQHSERIRELYIYHCDCRKEETFATIGILSRFPTSNLVTFEILEDYDFTYYLYKRGTTRAIPKSKLPWGRNLSRISSPGSWLHMLISGPRPFVTTLEIDDAFLSRKNFKAMAKNMPMLTTLILRNEHYVRYTFTEKDDLTYIEIPSLKLFRLEYYDPHRLFYKWNDCLCLHGRLVAPNLEVFECSSKIPLVWDERKDKAVVSAPPRNLFQCLFNPSRSLYNLTRSSVSLRKVRLENVNAPYKSLNLLHKPPHFELVFNSDDFVLEKNTVPFSIPQHCEKLVLDFVGWRTDLADKLLLHLTQDISRTGVTFNTLNLHLPPSFPHTTLSQIVETFGKEVVKISHEATVRSSFGHGTNDDLGHLARHHGLLRESPIYRDIDDYDSDESRPHVRLSPRPSMDGMKKAYSSDLYDEESDEEWEPY